jgi:hypothetical protein
MYMFFFAASTRHAHVIVACYIVFFNKWNINLLIICQIKVARFWSTLVYQRSYVFWIS